jgi:tetratricopeptide (TPR) repeat protein
MDGVIKAEPNDGQHYRFRAEILRLGGKLDRARRDYQQMTKLDPQSAVGYNGLAEVNLQAGSYDAALEAARRAYALAPKEWVAAYNLGMIEDRLRRSRDVIEHLTQALAHKVPDTRHRLLIHLYLARAYSRLGNEAGARAEVDAMVHDRRGLKEWQTLLESDQATTLRAVLGEDIQTAEAVVEGRLKPSALGESSQ